MLESYEKLPVIVRWVLYVPAVLFISYLVLFLISILNYEMTENVIRFVFFQIFMAFVAVLSIVYFSFHLAPKYKVISATIIFSVISLLQLLSLIKIAAKIYYPDMSLVFQDGVDGVLITVWFVVGILYLKNLKNKLG